MSVRKRCSCTAKTKCTHPYYISYSHNGKMYFQSTRQADKKFAEAVFVKRKTEQLEGKFFNIRKSWHHVTVKELLEKYHSERHSNLRTPEYFQRKSLEPIIEFWGERSVESISLTTIHEFKQWGYSVKKWTPSTMNRRISALRHAYNYAIDEWGWELKPIKFKSDPLPPRTPSFLTKEEVDKLIVAAPDWFKPILVLATKTGLRADNLLSLKWSQIDLEKQIINVSMTKNGKPISLPMSKTVKASLEGILREGEYLFPNRFGDSLLGKVYDYLPVIRVRTTLKDVCQEAGVRVVKFHTLRHTFASHLVQAGVPIYNVRDLLGHKSLSSTMIYAHLSPANLKESVEALD